MYFIFFFACSSPFLLLHQLSLFFLSIFFFIDKCSISVADVLLTAKTFFLFFFSIFNGVQKCYMSADPEPEVHVGTALKDKKVSRE